MRFVADESCDFSVVRALRDAGHDVTVIAEIAPRIEDEEVLKLAHPIIAGLPRRNGNQGRDSEIRNRENARRGT